MPFENWYAGAALVIPYGVKNLRKLYSSGYDELFGMPDPAHPLTLWLVRASVACYSAAVLIAVSQRSMTERSFRWWRAAWSSACVLLIAHVLAAFHFEHHWSHTAALKHTAEQTSRVVGINWGGGLYFNYAFLILWMVDVAILWLHAARDSRLRRGTDLACIFMVFNATVVFGPRWWIGPAVALGLAVVWLRKRNPSEGVAPD